MRKKNKLPTILGIVILLIGTFAGVFFLNMRQTFRLGAAPEIAPKGVRISDISGTSATISWLTDSQVVGFVNFGDNSKSLKNVAYESDKITKFITHSVNLTGLSPKTQYFFKISSDGVTFDNNGIAWQFTTGPEIELNKNSYPVTGTVITASGKPSNRALVYLNVSGYLMSTITSNAGNFVFQLGSTRTKDLQNYASIDPATTLLEISVQAEGDSFSTAQIFPQAANPIPTLILGRTQDFRNLAPTDDSQNPDASLNLPISNEDDQSKFVVPTDTSGAPISNVVLESLSNGETISTDTPEFFGKGPEGQSLIITIHSDQELSGEVKIPKSGSWSWTPPQNLTPGPHTITVSWVDITGITRSLTRNFIVQAAEAPAFTASESGTIATPTPIGSPKPTAAAATPIPTESPAVVPITGQLTPTLFLFIMSIGIFVFSFGIWKIAEEKI